MSNVFARFHYPTGLDFWDTGKEIQSEVWKIVKNFPKSARFTHGIPIYNLARNMNVRICQANSIYPTHEDEVTDRKKLIQEAIGFNESILQQLGYAIPDLELDINKLDKLGELLIKESKLLRNWKSSTKLLTQKKQ